MCETQIFEKLKKADSSLNISPLQQSVTCLMVEFNVGYKLIVSFSQTSVWKYLESKIRNLNVYYYLKENKKSVLFVTSYHYISCYMRINEIQ